MSKITARPWIMRSMQDHCDVEGDATGYEIVGANNESITDDQTYYPTAPNAANAAHIVRCVNLHDELVDCLKALVDTIDTGNGTESMLVALRACRLIAKAEVGKLGSAHE